MPLSDEASDVLAHGGTTGEIVFAEPIPSRSRLCIALTGVVDAFGNPLCPEGADLEFVALVGDVDGDAHLDGADLALVESLLGTDPIDLGEASHLRADLDRDGRIDAVDRAIVRAQLGSSAAPLPPPCHAPPTQGDPCRETP